MALVKCRDCGSNVSKDANRCPKCGAPVVSPKTTVLVLVIVMAAVFAVAIFCDVTGTSKPFPLNILFR